MGVAPLFPPDWNRMAPNMHKVQSSALHKVGYIKGDRILVLSFQAGSVYEYIGVDESTFNEMLHAESVGRFYGERIRGRYPFRGPFSTPEV